MADRTTKAADSNVLSVTRQTGGGSYVQRFKIQKERIKTLHSDSSQEGDTGLPKLSKQQLLAVTRENTGMRKFVRSNTIGSLKLPGVNDNSSNATAATARKRTLPVKTFHMKLHPDHISHVSKSLPSLPSIPGSPPMDQGVSPESDLHRDIRNNAFPVSKHRYQKIAFQKTLHGEKSTLGNATVSNGKEEKGEFQYDSVYRNAMPRRATRHRVKQADHDNEKTGALEIDDRHRHSASTMSHIRLGHRRMSKESGVHETRSEVGYKTSQKWKDDCVCLRCQMLRRSFKEGDEGYKHWGHYPCHRVDPTISLDYDD